MTIFPEVNHMFRKIRSLSLEKQLFISFLAVSVLLLFLSLGTTLSYNLSRQRREIDRNISNIAAYIASLDTVAEMLEKGYPSPAAERELDLLHETFSDINVIVIYNTEGLRFYHTNRQESGETFVAGDEERILAGSSPYITTGYGTYGEQRRAFHAVTNADGRIIGFVMASVFTARISEYARSLFLLYLAVLFLMLIVSIVLANAIVRILRSTLMGHHPQELLDLYMKQDAVLNAMTEGIVATDRDGNIIFANHAAARLFPSGPALTGAPLAKLFPASSAETVIETGAAVNNESCFLNDHPLIYSELPIGDAPDIQGVLTIFNDRTEIESLSDELSGAQSMLDTLRAFNHEFLNKLHIILGYLQTGDTQKAIAFIMNSSLVSGQEIRKTADCLRVSRICALVIGKMMHAAELGILLTVNPDSRCHDADLFLPVDVYITVIGNLLENAIEELSAGTNADGQPEEAAAKAEGNDALDGEEKVREITLGVYCSRDGSIITCEDTGRGIPKELLSHIFEKGVSSKGEDRGTGLYLVRALANQYGGEIAVETEPGEGTCFTVTFTKEE